MTNMESIRANTATISPMSMSDPLLIPLVWPSMLLTPLVSATVGVFVSPSLGLETLLLLQSIQISSEWLSSLVSVWQAQSVSLSSVPWQATLSRCMGVETALVTLVVQWSPGGTQLESFTGQFWPVIGPHVYLFIQSLLLNCCMMVVLSYRMLATCLATITEFFLAPEKMAMHY